MNCRRCIPRIVLVAVLGCAYHATASKDEAANPQPASWQAEISNQTGSTVDAITNGSYCFIQGGVRSPGKKAITNEVFRLSDAILSAGGFTDFADRAKIEIIRSGGIWARIDYQAVKVHGSSDVEIMPGDEIRVPERARPLPSIFVTATNITVTAGDDRFCYIGGEVRSPGRIPMTNSIMFLTDVIQSAGGFTVLCDRTKVVEVRHDGTRLRVDYQHIEAHGTNDVVVTPGDRIYVPRRGRSSSWP